MHTQIVKVSQTKTVQLLALNNLPREKKAGEKWFGSKCHTGIQHNVQLVYLYSQCCNLFMFYVWFVPFVDEEKDTNANIIILNFYFYQFGNVYTC